MAKTSLSLPPAGAGWLPLGAIATTSHPTFVQASSNNTLLVIPQLKYHQYQSLSDIFHLSIHDVISITYEDQPHSS
jgi:hypothetical protein